MPLIFPPAPTTGTTYTDDNSCVWQFDGVKWNVVTGTTKRLFNGVKIGLSINYSLSNVLAPVSWDVEYIDTTNYYSSLDPSKIYIPATGYYTINVNVFADNSGAGYNVAITQNGVTTLSTGIMNPNQAASISAIYYFNQGDYIQFLASETSSNGALSNDTYFEVVLAGYALGTGVTPYSAFSGVKTDLNINYSTSSTPSAIIWTGTTFDTNANALAQTYWLLAQPTRITIKNTGYYEISSFLQTDTAGGTYTVTLKKNGLTTLSNATMQANETAMLDQVYQLNENDYLEIFVSDTLGSGAMTDECYLQVVRMGV